MGAGDYFNPSFYNPPPKPNLFFYPLYTYLCAHISRVQFIHLFTVLHLSPKKLLIPPTYQALTKVDEYRKKGINNL